MGDESLRTSVWEAKDRLEHQVLLGIKQLSLIFVMHLGGLGRQVRNPAHPRPPPISFYRYLFRIVPLHLSSMPNLPAFLKSKMVATDKCTECLFD